MARSERQLNIIEIIKNKEIETQGQLVDELVALGYKVTQATVSRDIKELNLIKKNINGRYEYNGVELTCGCSLEYLAKDSWHMIYDENDEYVMVPYWKYGRIEADEKGYYIVGADKNVELEGLHVRNR